MDSFSWEPLDKEVPDFLTASDLKNVICAVGPKNLTESWLRAHRETKDYEANVVRHALALTNASDQWRDDAIYPDADEEDEDEEDEEDEDEEDDEDDEDDEEDEEDENEGNCDTDTDECVEGDAVWIDRYRKVTDAMGFFSRHRKRINTLIRGTHVLLYALSPEVISDLILLGANPTITSRVPLCVEYNKEMDLFGLHESSAISLHFILAAQSGDNRFVVALLRYFDTMQILNDREDAWSASQQVAVQRRKSEEYADELSRALNSKVCAYYGVSYEEREDLEDHRYDRYSYGYEEYSDEFFFGGNGELDAIQDRIFALENLELAVERQVRAFNKR